jgi:putative endonuclease
MSRFVVIAGLDPAIHHLRMSFWVYILASKRGGTLYVGITNDLVRRVCEHRNELEPGFTKRYGLKQLVNFEQHDTAYTAIQREKNIKHWSREWKIDLIVSMNPDWRDLYDKIAS